MTIGIIYHFKIINIKKCNPMLLWCDYLYLVKCPEKIVTII